jgi:glycosyltransferase involved in cell wall biosynthesis
MASDSPKKLKILNIENCFASDDIKANPNWDCIIDYEIYNHWPKWWRCLEKKVRLDVGLAIEARKISGLYDLIWVWSEKVSIPSSIMGFGKPTITVFQNLSRGKIFFLRLLNISKRATAFGYISDYDRSILTSLLNIPEEKLFRALSAPIDRFTTGGIVKDGPIISLGTAKRDYPILIRALDSLPGYQTEIYSSSKYGDRYKGNMVKNLPNWVSIIDRVSDQEIINRYQKSKFVVIPLMSNAHAGAGSTVALEAASCGKAVIATKTKGMETFVRDGETGILVPTNNSDALSNAIHNLWNNPDLAHQMGQNGRHFVEEKFNPDDINNRILQIINQACTVV